MSVREKDTDGMMPIIRAADSISAACIVISPDSGKISHINPAALRLLDCTGEEEALQFSGGVLSRILSPYDRTWENGKITEGQTNCCLKTKSGRLVHVCCFVQKEACGQYSCMLFPLTDSILQSYDSLTALPGMRAFLAQAEKEIDALGKGELLYFIHVNLVGFKRYNVLHGFEQGDAYLRCTAEVLTESFPYDTVSRFSADNFVILSHSHDVLERVEKAEERIEDMNMSARTLCKVGIYIMDGEDKVTASHACDFAKAACDSIHDDNSRFVQTYNRDVAYRIERSRYMVDSIDKAIDNGWIQIYCQPIVRTLTGHMCGYEALARWNDPVYGFMNPGDFISVLEASHQIHKLDCFMVREICRIAHEEIAAGREAVPVSFNLSRLDFLLCDMFAVIEDAVHTYEVPRDLLHIEITESTVIEDAARMHEDIRRFREAGYQVWMDDYGSGYSSLNVLKDYHFDVLKIDMDFMRSFSDTSRKIVASTVRMAKQLGISPLAEGVETAEQLAFLKRIGCSMVQGYYFGRPALYADCRRQNRENGVIPEPRAWHKFFDELSLCDVQPDTKTVFLSYDGTELRILFANEKTMDFLRQFGREDSIPCYTPVRDIFGDTSENYLVRYINANTWSQDSGSTKEFVMTYRDRVLFTHMKLAAKARNTMAFVLTFTDISREQSGSSEGRASEIDSLIYSTLLMYDNIVFFNCDEDYCEAKKQDLFFTEPPGTHYPHIARVIHDYGKKMVYPADYNRYIKDWDLSSLTGKIRDSKVHSFMAQYRLLSSDGSYRWKVFNTILIPGADKTIILSAHKDSIIQTDPHVEAFYREYYKSDFLGQPQTADDSPSIAAEDVMHSMMMGCEIPFFWKDSDLRYAGMSNAFLELCDISGRSEIIGNTDEELGWTMDNEAVKETEEEILSGRKTAEVHVRRVVRGEIKDILVREIPVYSGGRIIGLAGAVKGTADMHSEMKTLKDVCTDPDTGLANEAEALRALIDFSMEAKETGKKGKLLLISIYGYATVHASYGPQTALHYMQSIGRALHEAAGSQIFDGRIGHMTFLVILPEQSLYETALIKKRIKEKLEAVKEVDGFEVTVLTRIEEVENARDVFKSELFLSDLA